MNSKSTNDKKYIFQGRHKNKLWFSNYKDTKLKILPSNPKYITPFVPDFFCIWQVYFGYTLLKEFNYIQDAIDYQNGKAKNIVTKLFLNLKISEKESTRLFINNFLSTEEVSPQFYFDKFCFEAYVMDPERHEYLKENATMYPKVMEKFGYTVGLRRKVTSYRTTPQNMLRDKYNATDNDIKQFNNRIHIKFERLDKEERFDEMLQLLNSEEYSQFLRNYIKNSNGILIPNIIKKGKINIQNL